MNINFSKHAYYTFHPFSKELKTPQKVAYTISNIFFTLGTLGIAPIVYSRLSGKVKKIKESPVLTAALENVASLCSSQLNREQLNRVEIEHENWVKESDNQLNVGLLSKEVEIEYQNWVKEVEAEIKSWRGRSGNADMQKFKELILKGKDQGWMNKESNFLDFKNSFLHIIALRGEPLEAVDILAEVGANFNFKETRFGNTPLMWAIANGNYSMASHILKIGSLHKIDVNVKDQQGKIPLMLLIMKGIRSNSQEIHQKFLRKLIEKSDINSQDKYGNTALHMACLRRDWEVAKLLLENGADKNH